MSYFDNRILLFCILWLLKVVSTFNVEELKWVNYEVDISVTPVKREEITHPVIYVTSKSGQEFQCLLPQLNEEEISEKEVINEKEEDVIELLKPMKSGSCLSKGKDWWTYEFCFGRYIKQFHVEAKISFCVRNPQTAERPEYYIKHADFDLSVTLEFAVSSGVVFIRGLPLKSQATPDGQIKGQVIALGFYDSDYDWNNETDLEKFKHAKQKYHSQYYRNGSKCDLTGQPRNAEVRIYCEEDAGDYIYRVDEPESCSYIITVHTSRLCSHPQLKPLPSNKAHPIPCHPILDEEQYSNYLQKLKEEKALAEKERNQFLTKQQQRLQVMKNENLQGEGKTESFPSEINKISNLKSVRKSDAMIRKFLLQEYDKEIEKLKTSLPPEKFAFFKNEIQKQFDSILQEARADVNSELSEESKDISISKLTSVLNMLLEKLDKAEKDVAQATKELSEATKSVISDVHVSDSEGDLHKESIEKDKKEKENYVYEEALKVMNSDESKSAVLDDDKLQVRIRRLDRKPSDASGKLHEIDFEQRKKLEEAVKEKLEKAGFDTGGRRIEVKIITSGYYDNEDGKDFQSLTDEETDQFQSMIMAVLTGPQEAVQEMKKHKKLEENYKFTWNDNEEMDSKEE